MVKPLERLSMAYGVKIIGFRPIVFVAPHCPEDHEQFVNELVAKVCTATGCFAVINTKIPRQLVDLNNSEEIEKSDDPAVKRFYGDLLEMVRELSDQTEWPWVLFVHFTPRFYTKRRFLYEREQNGRLAVRSPGQSRDFDIDIGCGLAETLAVHFSSGEGVADEDRYVSAKKIRRNRGHGTVTCNQNRVAHLQRLLTLGGMRTKVGREWAALAESNMVQHVAQKIGSVSVVQLEIIQDVGERREAVEALIQVVENLI
ncbi:TPA: hypothetical protein DF272_04615 [Candidatus Falkowbacteria bacterium]|nr:hypothetical protein [Candidatus Falkowbacteria bacterium]